jgi:teichuronic acid biosynthesis glycosyltransferase TuaH
VSTDPSQSVERASAAKELPNPNVHVLILSTADWNRPLWTNKQFIARELARYMQVTYVNSIGLRRPSLSVADASRVFDRLLRSRKPASKQETDSSQNLTALVSPLVIPLYSSQLIRSLNRYIIERCITQWRGAPKDQRILWSFSPITYGLEAEAAAAVYHCVDLLGEFPGVDAKAVSRAERELAEESVTAIASSTVVKEHLHRQGFSEINLWENVADVATFVAHSGDRREPGLAVFAGNLTEHKVDFDLLAQVAESDGVRLILAGTVAEGGGGTGAPKKLIDNPNVDYVGSLKPPELAALLGRASVGLIPYQLNDYTAGVFPMKVYEYLGAGLPVVTTRLPSISHLGNADLIITDTISEFVESVSRFTGMVPLPEDIDRRIAIADEHSWERRGAEAVDLIRSLVDSYGRE